MASRMARNLLDEMDTVDVVVYRAVAQTPSPRLDTAMSDLSNAADLSGLWLAIAAGLAAVRPPPPPRRRGLCRAAGSPTGPVAVLSTEDGSSRGRCPVG